MLRAWWVLVLVGCIGDPLVPCGDLSCPSGSTCTPRGCASEAAVIACTSAATGDTCTAQGIDNGVCDVGACWQIVCGDRLIDPGEVCDDGNQLDGDLCSATCTSDETCGNGTLDPIQGEECDDGVVGLSSDGCSSRCRVESEGWLDVSPRPIHARGGMQLVYDPVRQNVVTFGGFDESGLLDDTWVFRDNLWRPRFPVVSPPARIDYAMTFDAARERVIMFGGHSQTLDVLDDMWEWDGVTWRELQPATRPPPERYGTMAYDVGRGRALLYTRFTKETWEWDGTTWTKRAPTTVPATTSFVSMVYDAVNASLLLLSADGMWTWNGDNWVPFLGARPTFNINNRFALAANAAFVVMLTTEPSSISDAATWVWNGVSWTKAPAGAEPAGRTAAGAARSPEGAVIVLGGYSYDPQTSSILYSDTWVWNGAWSEAPQDVGLQPPATYGHGMVYDDQRGRIVLFGGFAGGPHDETWEYVRGEWAQIPTDVQPPTRRTYHGMAYDADRGVAVLFGGDNENGERLADTWELEGFGWMQRTPATSPPARYEGRLVYDYARKRVVLFGGADDNGYLGDTWEWDGTTWTNRTPATGPSARLAHAMAYDRHRERVVLFGGYDTAPRNDTWEWDGTTWTLRSPTDSPPALAYTAMAYDPIARHMVLADYDSTWSWDGTNWTRRATQPDAPIRYQSPLVFDAIAHQLVRFAGNDFIGGYTGQTWAYESRRAREPAERCLLATEDADGDGLAGCADPDCYGRCDPLCPPGVTCGTVTPKCGDSVCTEIEDSLICPTDCP